MPVTVAEIETLRRYVGGVMQRAEHHANLVDEVVLALVGAVVWKKDADTPLEVRAQQGQMGNVLWMTISGTKYAFSYNHDAKTIEMRQGALTGAVVASFSNATTIAQVKQQFEGL